MSFKDFAAKEFAFTHGAPVAAKPEEAAKGAVKDAVKGAPTASPAAQPGKTADAAAAAPKA